MLSSRSECKGFTLIELMVTISILAILTTIAVPSFQRAIASGRLSNSVNEFNATLTLARSEAMRRGIRVTVCKSSDGATCDTDSATPWNVGWIMFDDTIRTNAANAVVDAGETVRQVVGAQPSNISILGNADANLYVSYAPNGRTYNMVGGFLSGTLSVCSTSSSLDDLNRARLVRLLGNTGRLTIAKPNAPGIDKTCPAPL
jgi:type IV fimbrial biogenesis protein FimT